MRARFVELAMTRLAERGNRIQTENAICAASAIVGERCIDAAGDFPLRDHDLGPGQRVFDARVSQALCDFGRHRLSVWPLVFVEANSVGRGSPGEARQKQASFPSHFIMPS